MPQYSKTAWVDGLTPAINATNLNKLEQGVFDSIRQDGSTTMSAQLVTIAGTAATPAIAPTGDANTGIFFPAADTIAFGEGGAEAMRITSAGRVGIGLTNPETILQALDSTKTSTTVGANVIARFQSNGSGADTCIQFSDGVANVVKFGMNSGNFVWLSDNTTERMRITSAGNVGIGTTSPNDKLEVVGGIRRKQVTAGTTASPASEIGLQYQFDNTANRSGIYFLNSYNSNGAAWMSFWTSNTSNIFAERMRIDAAGNVGVGTESPTVAANVTTHCLNNTSGSQYELFVNGARTAVFTASSTTVSLRNLTANPLLFFTNSIERLHIESGGNVRPSANNSQELGSSLYRWSTIYAQNALNTSDARLKTDVTESSLGLNFIAALNPVQFRYIEGGNTVERVQTGTETVEITPAIPAQPEQAEILDEEGNVIQAYVPATEEVPAVTEERPVYEEVVTPREGVRTHFGLIAQEVKAALPDGLDFGGWALADKDDADSTQFLGYMELIAPMIKAIQELKSEVDALKSQLNKQ